MHRYLFRICLIVGFLSNARSHCFAQGGPHDHVKHGFILVGSSTHFLYHLSKFNSPHRWQGIFTVELYRNGERLYNLPAVKKGVLSALSRDQFEVADLGSGTVPSFTVELYDGYLRSQDKVKIADEITVKIGNPVYFKALESNTENPSELSYIGFGDEKDYYLAHRITGAPNFEQLLKVKHHFGERPPDGQIVNLRRKDDAPLSSNETNLQGFFLHRHLQRSFTFSVVRQYFVEAMQ